VLQIGEWRVDSALDELRRGEEIVKLEPRMTRLLCCLAERPGEVFSADELLEKVWPGVVVNPSSVYQVIALLRKNLGDEGDEPRYIATVPRKGYRLIASVTRLGKNAPAPEPAPTISPTRAEAAPSTPTPPAAHPARRWGLAAAALLALVAIYFGTRTKDVALAESAPPALVVLPLTDLSADGSNEAFCIGLTDELLNALGRVPGLKVTGRTSAIRAREDRIETRELGRVLGVTHVLEGSVRATAGRLRVSAQLVSTADGFQVWSNSFDRPRSEAIGIQTDIARAVVDALKLQLDPAQADRLGRAPTQVVNAYELYLLGRHQQYQRKSESAERAIEYQKQAIAADPNFALAHAGLADAYMASARFLNRTYPQAIALAQPEVDAALRLDPELAEGYVAWGTIQLDQWDNLGARKSFEKALAINPNYGIAMHGLGLSFEWNAETRPALEVYERASALDPLNAQIHISKCNGAYSLGKFAEAERACLRANELQPEVPNSLVTYSETAQFQGDIAGAIERMTQALARAPRRFDLRTRLGVLYLDVGLTERAFEEFRKAKEDGADAANLAKQLYGLAAQGGGDALAKALRSVAWQDAPVKARAEAAYLAHIAGDSAFAQTLRESVEAELTKSADPMEPGYYGMRLGTCELCSLAMLERATGKGDAAAVREQFVLARLDRLQANGHVPNSYEYFRGMLSAARGDAAAALKALETAVERGWRRAWLMRLDPAFSPLRSEPRFQALLAKIDAANAKAREAIAAHESKMASIRN
jgi:TolB-like protein/DNA-binding winged helix-turn-helix (wHTH) protein/Tfp pilus assembly protein PilF